MKIYDGRESFYQWDLNQKITSDDFKVGDKIHFSNMIHPLALSVKAYELDGQVVADVPNILLQTTYSIKAFRYVSNPTSGQTVDERTFIVKQKAQPSDYFYTETELYSLRSDVERAVEEADEAVAQIHEGLENAQEALELATKAEKTSSQNEQARITTEEQRESAETTRETAETKRVNAEKSRVSAESLRVEAENKRVSSENSRSTNESTRVVAENERLANERGRQSNETARKSAESTRSTNETTRQTNESGRVTAESKRVSAETLRAEAESKRTTAESTRVTNEQGRVVAETSRETAEQARQTAETLRQTNFEQTHNNVANALKGIVSGKVVRVDDVSPIEHTVKAKVVGKNIIPYPFKETTKTVSGVTFTDNGDGSITVNGTATAGATFSLNSRFTVASAGIYTLSGCPAGGSGSSYMLAVNYYVGDVETTGVRDIGNWYSISLQQNTDVKLYIYIAKGQTVSDLTFRPQFELGDTATEYTPYVDPSSVTVTRYGVDENDNKQTYIPNKDGTCNIPSLSPTMTLLTDTEGVTIALEYNQDSNLVREGMREDITTLDNTVAEVIVEMSGVNTTLENLSTQINGVEEELRMINEGGVV